QFGNPIRVINAPGGLTPAKEGAAEETGGQQPRGNVLGSDNSGPGLYFKIPFIQNVEYFDKRILDIDTGSEEVIASDQRELKLLAWGEEALPKLEGVLQQSPEEVRGPARVEASRFLEPSS